MEIKLASLPSLGYKSNLPESFNMEPFGPQQFPLLAKAAETNDKRYLLQDALSGVLDIDVGMLTVQDAHALVFQQRMLTTKVRPVTATFHCVRPIYTYEDGEHTVYDPSRPLIRQRPCDTYQSTTVDASNLTIKVLNATSDEYDLPRMEFYEASSKSMFDWVIAHHGLSYYEALHHFETNATMEEFTKLAAWVESAQHGLVRTIDCACDECGKTTQVTWDMPANIFLL